MCLAIPGEILDLEGEALTRTGRVSFDGIVKVVNLSFVPEAVPGDFVLVHVGVAISRVDDDEAARTLAALRGLTEPER